MPPNAGKRARGVWAGRERVSFDLQMGMNGKGQQQRDLSWKGPGEIFRPGPGEPSQRAFYRHWVEQMRERD